MHRPRILPAFAIALLIALATATSAVALVDLSSVAASDVAVESGAGVSAAQRSQLVATAAALRGRGTPVRFVVLRATPDDSQAYANSLRKKLVFGGDVLVLSPGNLRIASGLRNGDVQDLFDRNRAALRADSVSGTIAVAVQLSALHSTGGSGSGSPAPGAQDDSGGGGSGGGAILLGILALGAAAVIIAVLVSRRGSTRRAGQDVAAQRDSLEPLVDGLAAQIGDLDDDMRVPGDRTTAATPHYDTAVLSYGEARDLLATQPAPSAVQIRAAGAALEKGLRAARRTRAVLEGRTPESADQEPLLEGMCSFDPKHGTATTSVTITTPGGQKAELPACASCAADMAAGNQPRFREVEHHGQMVPYWTTGGMGGARMGGAGGLGPVLGGALAGMILGGLFGGGDANASQGDNDTSSGWGGDWSAGGGGGGDFGGGGGDSGGGGGGDF